MRTGRALVRSGVLSLVLALTAAVLPSARAGELVSAVPSPHVSGPVGTLGLRGHQFNRSVVPLPGYREDEFLFDGTARRLTTTPRTSAPFRSRMIVRRPVDAKAFNGTVYVEWLNVTAQQDLDQHWPPAYRMIMRDGAAYVAVSAQQAGVRHLGVWDPIRYGSLVHPGDDYSFDIFAQAIAAVRRPSGGGVDPMGGLKVKRVVATGHSQSGGRLHTYVDEVQDQTQVVDAFFLTGQSDPVFDVAQLRTPVIAYMSDAEMTSALPAPSPWLRTWHVAGTAHNGTWYAHYLADELARDYGLGLGGVFDETRSGEYGQELNPLMAPPGLIPAAAGCPNPNGAEMPDRYAISAALHHLDRWARDPSYASAVPQPPLAQFDSEGNLVRDEYGNVAGGLRLPPIEVPVATYVACGIVVSGTYVFDPLTLRELYPSLEDYVAKMQAATDRALAAGYLLPEDATDLMARARRAFLGQL